MFINLFAILLLASVCLYQQWYINRVRKAVKEKSAADIRMLSAGLELVKKQISLIEENHALRVELAHYKNSQPETK